jgi:hypothetical protein
LSERIVDARQRPLLMDLAATYCRTAAQLEKIYRLKSSWLRMIATLPRVGLSMIYRSVSKPTNPA